MAGIERRRGYHPNHSMTDGLGGFMMDPSKTGRIALQAAGQVIAIAKADAVTRRSSDEDGDHISDHYSVQPTVVVVNENPPNPRLSALAVNDHRAAARDEFGASPGHKGANRSLRKAGARIGELRGDIG